MLRHKHRVTSESCPAETRNPKPLYAPTAPRISLGCLRVRPVILRTPRALTGSSAFWCVHFFGGMLDWWTIRLNDSHSGGSFGDFRGSFEKLPHVAPLAGIHSLSILELTWTVKGPAKTVLSKADHIRFPACAGEGKPYHRHVQRSICSEAKIRPPASKFLEEDSDEGSPTYVSVKSLIEADRERAKVRLAACSGSLNHRSGKQLASRRRWRI